MPLKFLRLSIILGIFSILPAAVPADPAVPEGFGQWQRVKVGDFMTVKIPGKFNVTSIDHDAETTKKILSEVHYELDNSNSDDYYCLVGFLTYNKGYVTNLDGWADGFSNGLKDNSSVSDFKAQRKTVHRSKTKGILVTGSYVLGGKQCTFQALGLAHGNLLWEVMISDSTDKQLTAVTKAIMDSVQIKN